jgi:membrane fusion protein (multidrug efflux system)
MKTDKSAPVGEQDQILAAPEAAKSNSGDGKAKVKWLFWPGLVSLTLLLYWGLGYVMDALTHESTDDAFIEAHVVSIAPKISGQVSSVSVADNQPVKRGDLLVEIDPRDYEMRLSQKRASAQTSDANLKTVFSAFDLMKAKVDTAEASAKEARAEADASQAVAARAGADFKRGQQLFNEGAISRQEFDHAQSATRETDAKWKADEQKAVEEASKVAEARAQLAAAKTVVELAEAQIKQAQTDVNSAELDLSYTKIQAPCDGRVTRKAVEAGSYVQSGQTLLAIVPNDLWIIANFKETQLAHMRPRQPVDIEIEALPGRHFRGHVDSIQAGSGSRFSLLPPENAVGSFVKVVQRVPVKILFDEPVDPGRVVGPGMSVLPSVRVKDEIIPRWTVALVAALLAGAAGFAARIAAMRVNNRAPANP